MLGFRNQSELPGIYAMADALVLPSDEEPWGLVVNEALASSTAVVASDRVGASLDLLEPEAVFPPGDIGALARVLDKIAGDPAFLERLRSRGQARLARWGISDTADGFIAAAERAGASLRCTPRHRQVQEGG